MGVLVSYRKLITGHSRAHLIPSGQADADATTLCGCTVTHAASWKVLTALEGDECTICAERAFGPSAVVPS